MSTESMDLERQASPGSPRQVTERAESRSDLFEDLVRIADHWDRERLRFISYEVEIPTRWVNNDADRVYLSLEAAVHAEYLRDRAEECHIKHTRAARSLIEEGFPVEQWITLRDEKTVVYVQPASRRVSGNYAEPAVLFEEITDDSEPVDTGARVAEQF